MGAQLFRFDEEVREMRGINGEWLLIYLKRAHGQPPDGKQRKLFIYLKTSARAAAAASFTPLIMTTPPYRT